MQSWSPRLLALALMVILVGAVGCASQGDLQQAQEDLVTTQAELAQARQDVDSLTGRLTTLEGDLATARTELAQEQAGFQAALTTAAASLGAVQGDLTTLSSDFDALKNSFLLSRDDVTGNKKGVEALQAQQEQRGQDVKYTSVANLYALVWLVNGEEGVDAVTTALGIAVGATGDSQLQGALGELGGRV